MIDTIVELGEEFSSFAMVTTFWKFIWKSYVYNRIAFGLLGLFYRTHRMEQTHNFKCEYDHYMDHMALNASSPKIYSFSSLNYRLDLIYIRISY